MVCVRPDVSITHLTFSKEFTKAIEQKQVAEQEAERQMYVVQQAEQEKLVSAASPPPPPPLSRVSS